MKRSIFALFVFALISCQNHEVNQSRSDIRQDAANREGIDLVNGLEDNGMYFNSVVRFDDGQYTCSGTIISTEVVLTAAHCVVTAGTGELRPASSFAIGSSRDIYNGKRAIGVKIAEGGEEIVLEDGGEGITFAEIAKDGAYLRFPSNTFLPEDVSTVDLTTVPSQPIVVMNIGHGALAFDDVEIGLKTYLDGERRYGFSIIYPEESVLENVDGLGNHLYGQFGENINTDTHAGIFSSIAGGDSGSSLFTVSGPGVPTTADLRSAQTVMQRIDLLRPLLDLVEAEGAQFNSRLTIIGIVSAGASRLNDSPDTALGLYGATSGNLISAMITEALGVFAPIESVPSGPELVDPSDLIVLEGEVCGEGYTGVSYQDLVASDLLADQGQMENGQTVLSLTPEVCRGSQQISGMGTWYIVRLSDGGSVDGRGYQCRSRDEDTRSIGHVLCKEETVEVAKVRQRSNINSDILRFGRAKGL